MKFRLIYDGELPSEQQGNREAKHAIRRQIHPQLRALWTEHPALKGYAVGVKEPHGAVSDVTSIANDFEAHGFRWVPLLREVNGLACRLDLLVLMRQEPHHVFSGSGGPGDLDNRIKTFIDGLKKPKQRTELPDVCSPLDGEDPFYCLLEDDRLIHEFNVTTDRLLAPPRPDQASRDVVVVVNVHVTTVERYELSAMTHEFGYSMARGFGYVSKS